MMEPMPGTQPIVDQAVDEAAQTLFSAVDVPLARSDELLAAIQGPAVQAVMHARIEQIVKHGHTAAGDAMLPIGLLANESRSHVQNALDVMHRGERQNLPVARRRLAKAAALLLAAIDRVDVAISENPPTAAAIDGGAA